MKKILCCLLFYTFISCSNNQQNISNTSLDENIKLSSQQIPYHLGSNYFVRNDFNTKSLKRPYINTDNEFESIFGIAETMSTKNKSTKIDFNNQVAVPIILEPTNIGTTIQIDDIFLNGNIIKIKYIVKEVEKISYIIQPSEVIIIDRKNLPKLENLKFEFEKIKNVL